MAAFNSKLSQGLVQLHVHVFFTCPRLKIGSLDKWTSANFKPCTVCTCTCYIVCHVACFLFIFRYQRSQKTLYLCH